MMSRKWQLRQAHAVVKGTDATIRKRDPFFAPIRPLPSLEEARCSAEEYHAKLREWYPAKDELKRVLPEPLRTCVKCLAIQWEGEERCRCGRETAES